MQNSNGYGIASNIIFVRVCDIFSEEIWYSIINSYKYTTQLFEKEYFPLDIVCTYDKIQTKFKYATLGCCLIERSILAKKLLR